jgi:hypothetical protein
MDPSIAAAQTFLGDSSTVNVGRHGPTTAQVKITVDAGKITAIQTVALSGTPGWPASCINPTITNRALAAQSASVQGVSCASYSSAAWKNSLASAISKASSALNVGTTIVAPAPATTIAPKPATTTAPKSTPTVAPTFAPRVGGDDEDGEEGEHHGYGNAEGEGDDDGYRVPRPPRAPHKGVVAPAPVITPKATVTPKATLAPKKTVAPKAAATPSTSLGLVPKAGVIAKTITCVKGKLTKTVKSTNPKCPTGYTLKK